MASDEGIPMCHLLILLNFGTLVTIIMLLIKLFDLFLTKHNQMVEKLKFCGKCPCLRSCGQSPLPRMLKSSKVQDSSTLTFSSSSTTSSAPPLAQRALRLDNSISGQASSGLPQTHSTCCPATTDTHGYTVAAKRPGSLSERAGQQDRPMTSPADVPLDLSARRRETFHHADDRVAKQSSASIASVNADGSHRNQGNEIHVVAGNDYVSTMLIPAPARRTSSGNDFHENFHMENLLKQIAKFKEVTLSRINELTTREVNKNHSFVWPRHDLGKIYKSLDDSSVTSSKQLADVQPRKNWRVETADWRGETKEAPLRTWQEIMRDYGFKTHPEVATSPPAMKATSHMTSSVGYPDRNRSFRRSASKYHPHGLIESTTDEDVELGGKCVSGDHASPSSQFLRPHCHGYSPANRGLGTDEAPISNVQPCPSLLPTADVLHFRRSDTAREVNSRSSHPTNLPGIHCMKNVTPETHQSDTECSQYHSRVNYSPSDHALVNSKVTTSSSACYDISNKFPSESQMNIGLDSHSEPSSYDFMKIFNTCYHSNHQGGGGALGTYNNAMTLLQEEKERLEKIDAIISTTSSRQSEAGSVKSELNGSLSDGNETEDNRPNSAPNLSNNHLHDLDTRTMGKSGSAPPSVKYLDHSTEGDRSLIFRSHKDTPGLSLVDEWEEGLAQTKSRKCRCIVRSWQGAGGGVPRVGRGYQVKRFHRVGYVTRSRLHGGGSRMRKKHGGSKTVQSTDLDERA